MPLSSAPAPFLLPIKFLLPFELSVATFEIIYMIYPYTFGRFVHLGSKNLKSNHAVT